LYDHLPIKLLLAAMERLGGIKILAKNTPSVLYLPEALYPSNGDQASGLDPWAGEFLFELSRAISQQHRVPVRNLYLTQGTTFN
jgi:hypothetical protein